MAAQTLIFVDVDGVLNVGLSQGDTNTLMLSLRNMALARRVQLDSRASKASKDAAESLFNLAAAPLSGEAGTLQKYMCPDHGISDLLVERLAKLLLAAGPSAHVVLSSSWRHERHAAKRDLLERKISQCVGQSFSFHGVTATDRKEHTGGDRLELLGDYLEEYSQQIPKDQSLVLDDFFLCPMGWTVGKKLVQTQEEMRDYIKSRAQNHVARVKIVYTYDEWTMRLGKLHASIGLQMSMYIDALNFLQDKVEEAQSELQVPETRTTLLLKSAEVLPIKTRPRGVCPCQSVILAL
eukprot:s2542_g2.t1